MHRFGEFAQMEQKFKKSLIGYNPLEVENRINELCKNYESKVNELEENLSALTGENSALKLRISKIKEEIQAHRSLKEKIGTTLTEVYMRKTKEVWKALEEVKQTEKTKASELLIIETEKIKIKMAIESFSKELHKIFDRYKSNLNLSDSDRGVDSIEK